jgi:hypothetical protein
MKSKRSLITALIGLAMLATPITAAAKDHHDGGGKWNHSHQWESRSYNAPVRSYENHHEFRNEHNWAPVAHRDWNEDRHEYKRWNRGWGDADDYRNYGRDYGYRSYNAAPAYTPYYGGSGYGGDACAWARHIQNVYARDRYTGHPAAAADLLPRLRRAQQACGGVPYGGGLFSGYGAPAYADYSGYGGNDGYGGYNGSNGYNYNGYNQPGYASMLAPLLQQFVH